MFDRSIVCKRRGAVRIILIIKNLTIEGETEVEKVRLLVKNTNNGGIKPLLIESVSLFYS